MANGLPAYARETDLELATPALAANVKFIEALLETEPQNAILLLYAAQGLGTYAYAVVEGQMMTARQQATPDAAMHARRAGQFYRRGLDYGLRLLSHYHADWQHALSVDLPVLNAHLQQLPTEAAPALFWTAFCWGGMLNLSRDALDTIVALPRFEAMLTRLLQLDEHYFYGAPHLLLAVHYASRTPALGGKPEQARQHFARAETLSQTRLLLAPLLEAQYYAVQIQDRDLFKARLQHILDAPETLFPEQALLNAVAKQRAAFLLQRIDDLFV
ncbi:MAG: TRAP transporter TatT component family protein [Candidatus Tectomicrobia bacterium]|nr:TRAP transporter TatT component family protein [Candidatus Tectomicrobia bacterium]